jgi:hypothetical protein
LNDPVTHEPTHDAPGAERFPDAIVEGFDDRRHAMFAAESGQPLARAAKRPPLSPGRGQFVRYYSWSLMAFAARCFYLDQMLDEANAALAENAQHYLDHAKDIHDRDSFHWHGEMVLRLIEQYGSAGSVAPGRITPHTEALVLEPIWLYVKNCSSLAKADAQESQTWHVYGSENHHAMDFVLCWHFAKLAKDRPAYQDKRYDDGATAAEHYLAWNQYVLTYGFERACKGPCIEMMSDHYNCALIKGFYNLHDFGDPQVRQCAGQMLDLFFAYWAQEQINGVQGGGRSRIYFHEALQGDLEPGIAPLIWLYFGMGQRPDVHGFYVNAALSDYRPPAVVADLALDIDGRGRFITQQRAQGLGKQGRSTARVDHDDVPNKLCTDGGGIIRYTFVDPAFVMGTLMTEARPLADWTHISAQNRWQGVIFAGPDDARIVPIVRPDGDRATLNAFWSVQAKSTLITQKLSHHRGGAEMMVWFSQAGLSAPTTEDGWTFVESQGAYAAVRAARGDVQWTDEVYTINKLEGFVYQTRPGKTMRLDDEYAPVIIEVVAKSDIDSLDAFKAGIKACPLSFDGPVLEYTSIQGDAMNFDTSGTNPPTVNGTGIDYAPPKVLDSPYLNADYNSGIVTISKGARRKVLDFMPFAGSSGFSMVRSGRSRPGRTA